MRIVAVFGDDPKRGFQYTLLAADPLLRLGQGLGVEREPMSVAIDHPAHHARLL